MSIQARGPEYATPEERAAYLRQACGDDAALRASVEALLRADAGASGFMDRPPPEPAATVDAPGGERPGTVIGPYKLIEPIGEGGMGTVWMAQQTAPVKRLVAVKLIKAGMDTKQVIARFEAERQALALMDHPNIAKVLDAGATPEGRPYFAMELVKGIPITRYCDEGPLHATRSGWSLFVAGLPGGAARAPEVGLSTGGPQALQRPGGRNEYRRPPGGEGDQTSAWPRRAGASP